MIARTAILLCLAAIIGGVVVVADSTRRIGQLRAEIAGLEATGRAEGDSFVRTLQGAHAERQLQAFDQRRALAMALVDARRNGFLGVLGAAGGALGASAVIVLGRIARELDDARRLLEEARGGMPREGR